MLLFSITDSRSLDLIHCKEISLKTPMKDEEGSGGRGVEVKNDAKLMMFGISALTSLDNSLRKIGLATNKAREFWMTKP